MFQIICFSTSYMICSRTTGSRALCSRSKGPKPSVLVQSNPETNSRNMVQFNLFQNFLIQNHLFQCHHIQNDIFPEQYASNASDPAPLGPEQFVPEPSDPGNLFRYNQIQNSPEIYFSVPSNVEHSGPEPSAPLPLHPECSEKISFTTSSISSDPK
ncbi:hypothetical protein AMECASPLE_015561 [Ameca splendens]|uniref:Uncharacterized protein n=1 Tax=Ameca splendens TaxID=208324 RepID=A0ABV0ZYQ9_9TELE